ncbi:MAG: AbgT family transporter [Pseudomonadota bacterium]
MTDTAAASEQKGFLGWVERAGNKLPDPVFLFMYFIIALVIISIITAFLGTNATLGEDVLSGMPDSQKARFGIGADGVISAVSLFSPENIQRLWTEMPTTFTHFHPLGYVLVVMLGAGVAERSGFFASAIKGAVGDAPKFLLTPLVALVAMISNHAADAGYVVMIPLAAIIFAAAGRHPLAGIAAAFAGVSGGFSANLFPGQLDALLYGITEEAAEILNADYDANIAGNTYFIIGLLFLYMPIIWLVTDKIIEPRLGKWQPGADTDMQSYGNEAAPLTEAQKKGLLYGCLAMLGVVALWTFMTIGPGDALYISNMDYFKSQADTLRSACAAAQQLGDQAAITANCFTNDQLKDMADAYVADPANFPLQPEWYQRLTPFFGSLVAGFLILFLAAGWAYGAAAGTINNHRDLVNMMTEAMKDMGYYLVLSFAAAHFVAMFGWSNLGLISAVHGADAIESSGLPLPVLLGLIVLFSALINLFVGSASAKWALLAPVMVPMLMLLGVSPDGATAVYRVGDSATNIITPLMVYFPLILVFARRWVTDFGLGSLTAMMIPYSVWMLISGTLLVVLWAFLGVPLGPGAPMAYTVPG